MVIIIFFCQLTGKKLEIPYQKNVVVSDGLLDDWKNYSVFTFADTLHHQYATKADSLKAVYWQDADFSLISAPKSKNEVSVHACWNKNYLNFAFLVKDEHLHSHIKLAGEYPKIYLNDGIELYIDTKNDGSKKMDINDYQFIIDIDEQSLAFRGDRQLQNIDSIAVPKDYGQNVLYKYKVRQISGDENLTAIDHGYIVELSIPFASIGMEPEENYQIRLDLCNNDLDQAIPETAAWDKKYALGWSFNWNGQSDFGYPEYWKTAGLSGGPSLFEIISEKYDSLWLFSFFLSVLVSVIVITILILRMLKLNQMPKSVEVRLQPEHDENHDTLTENQQILKQAAAIIQQQSGDSLNSEQLAKSVGLSLRKFQRITRAEMNCTPTNFIYMIKLSLAAEFLVEKRGNISQAAYEFGFNDPAYFSKLFKKHYGVSPKEYVANNSKT